MTRWLLLLSDFFSVITIALCLILKIPQIIRLVKSGQAAGLSFNGLLLDISSHTVTMMYNYTNKHALLTYLEYPVIILQEYALLGFVMHYKDYKLINYFGLLTFYVAVSLAFAFSMLNKNILTVLLPLTTPVGAVSKIMQLHEIISKKNADSVSILTCFLSFFTNLTRIYTTYMDSADTALLMNFSVSTVLSCGIMLASIYYQKQSARRKTH